MLGYTALGRRIRAASEDPATAELVGVNARTAYAIASAIAIVTVTIAGCFLAMRSSFDPYAGPIQLIFAFEALIIGGTASLWGTLWGGILLGAAQTMGAKLHPQGFLIAGHGVFLLFLLLRLYGRPGWLSRLLRRQPQPAPAP
jgi:branched-chain amino acid transport system permease protein